MSRRYDNRLDEATSDGGASVVGSITRGGKFRDAMNCGSRIEHEPLTVEEARRLTR